MSPQESTRTFGGEAVQKEPTNVYTVMLILSFVFILIACVMLFLELRRFGEFPWWDTGGLRAISMTWAPWLPLA